eukprot:512206_1
MTSSSDGGVRFPLSLAKVFPGTSPVTSIDFHENGELCVTSDADDSITLINALEGKIRKTIYSKKYGANVVRYTHHDQSVLVSSTSSSSGNAIRYLSLYDNSWLRVFNGHTDKVVGVVMSPVDDCFLTGSADRSVRLWNLNEKACIASLQFPLDSSVPHVAYDPQGLIFAAMSRIGTLNIIKLYDARNYELGPFKTATIECDEVAKYLAYGLKTLQWKEAQISAHSKWAHIQFSCDGQNMLVTTDSSLILLVDAFECSIKQAFLGRCNKSGLELGACFTPDATYALSGSEDGNIYAWNVADGTQCSTMKGHTGPVGHVACSPKYELAVSSCKSSALWISSEAAQTYQ